RHRPGRGDAAPLRREPEPAGRRRRARRLRLVRRRRRLDLDGDRQWHRLHLREHAVRSERREHEDAAGTAGAGVRHHVSSPLAGRVCRPRRQMTRVPTAVGRALVHAVLIAGGVIGNHAAEAATNGLALSPPLGWTSWSGFQTEIDEESIKAVARVQADLLKESGYVYVNVDGGWYLNPDAEVDPYGRWVADRNKFPGGMAALGDYVHGLGLKFGLYVTPGIPALAVV